MDNQSVSDFQLQGRALPIVRAAWLSIVGLGVTLYVIGVPVHFAQWMTLCSGASCGIGQLTPQQAAQLPQVGLSLQSWAAFLSIAWAIPLLTALVIAGVIFWRKPDDRMALFAAFVLAISQIGAGVDYQSTAPILQFLTGFYSVVGDIVTILLLFVFPDGRFVPRWTRWVALLVILSALLTAFLASTDAAGNIVTLGEVSGVAVQIYRYVRVSNSVQRQQTKWVVFGIAVSTLSLAVVGLFFPTTESMQTVEPLVGILTFASATLFLAMVPLSIGIAILRSHLWDIDLIIRRTLIYGALTGVLALFYLGSVIVLQQVFRALTGQSSDIAIIVSTLAIAVLFNPLRHGVQETIDRRFYRRKYDAQRVLSQFGQTARDQVDINKLTAELLTVTEDTMQPAGSSLWLLKPASQPRNDLTVRQP